MSKRQPARTRHKARKPSWEEPRRRTSQRRKMPRLRYVPLNTVEPCDKPGGIDRPRKASAERIHCTCGKTYAGCSAMADPHFIDEDGEWTVVRRLYCDHCHHIVMWAELCRSDGTPTGLVKGEPATITKPSIIDAFLRRHPWAAGISQT